MTPPDSDWSPGIITLTIINTTIINYSINNSRTYLKSSGVYSLTRLVRNMLDCPLSNTQTLTKSTGTYWWTDGSIGLLIGWLTNPSRGPGRQSGVTLVKIITCRHSGRQLRCGTSGGFCVWIIDFSILLPFARSAPPGGFPVCTNTKAATLQIRQHKTICMLITVFRDCCVFALLSDREGGLSLGL